MFTVTTRISNKKFYTLTLTLLTWRKWLAPNNAFIWQMEFNWVFNPLNAELNPICYLLALLGAHHFLHVSRIRVKSLTLRLLMSYRYAISSLRVNTSAHCSGRKQVKG
jgi:hypothetical protein